MNRAFNLVIAILALPSLLPILGLLALWVKLDSPGPVFFVQRRVGRDEKLFNLIKLRTMTVGVGDHASHEVGADVITKAGHILRRFKLDELPQLINVLFGDLTLVGPRPCLPNQLELIEARRKLGIFSITPGITGLAQVRNIDMSTPNKLAQIDAEYMNSRSWRLDLKLIMHTFVGKGRGDAVLVE